MRGVSTAATMLFVMLAAATASARQTPAHPPLVGESGVKQTFQDGVIELRGSEGWLRTPRVYLDFQMTFEYQVASDANAGFIFRTWVNEGFWPRVGYRVNLPKRAADSHDGLVDARRQELSVIKAGRVDYRPNEEWQAVQVTGVGRRVTILINGTLAGEYEVESYGGHLLFENRKGAARFRSIKMSRLDDFGTIPVELKERNKTFEAEGGQGPRLVQDAPPVYTPEAYYGGVQGLVGLDVVVEPDGSPGAIRITESLNPELDLSAIAAVKRWRFSPARFKGEAVPLVVAVEVSFTIGARQKTPDDGIRPTATREPLRNSRTTSGTARR